MTTTTPEPGGPDFPKTPPPPDPTPSSAFVHEAGPANPAQPPGQFTAIHFGQPRPYHHGPAFQAAPGAQPYSNVAQRPSSNWGLSIVALFLCFIPGLVAVLYSAQVQQKWDQGDAEGSARASKNAQIWGIVGIVVGALLFLAVAGSGG